MKKTVKKQKCGLFSFLFEAPLQWFDWIFLLLFMGFMFLAYEMRDLYHTAGCSYGFLDGHFFDFYDYLSEYGIGEDGSVGLHASYMPTVYLIFALWNLPMKLFGFVPSATAVLGFIPIMWAKLLPCLAFIFGGYLLFLIGKELGMHDKKAKVLMYAYLAMPVSLYGQFILGQYESFLVLCILAGTLMWLRKKTVPFVLFFALGVTFKYTALIFFLPLLLLHEKRIFPILFKTLGAMSVYILELIVYYPSETFKNYAFGIGGSGDNPVGYVNNALYFTGFEVGAHLKSNVYLAFLAFAFVIAWAYFLHVKEEKEEKRYAMYLLCLAGASLFCFSKWHPHWLMVLVPFYTLTAFLHRDTKIFMAIDLLFTALFIMFCTAYFVSVTDEVMLENGFFKYLMPEGLSTYVRISDYICKLDTSTTLTLLTAIMAVCAVFKHPKWMAEDPNNGVNCMGWIRARYLGLLLFIVPSLLCVYYSVNPPMSAYKEEDRGVFLSMNEKEVYSQSFTAVGERLTRLQFPVSVGDHTPEDCILVTLTDEEGSVLYEKELSCSQLREGELVSLSPETMLETGNVYTVSFTLSEENEDSTFCLLGSLLLEGEDPALKNGEVTDYRLDMTVFQ